MNTPSSTLNVAPEQTWHLAHQIERLAARAVPAAERVRLGKWCLRLSDGIGSRRANSVLPLDSADAPTADDAAPFDSSSVAAAIDQAARLYHAHKTPLRLQMSPAVTPVWLDAYLHRQGFSRELPGQVMVAPNNLLPPTADRSVLRSVTVRSSPSDDWLALSLTHGSFRGSKEQSVARLLQRIEPIALYATAYEGTEPIGIGMGVIESGWLGIFSLATHPMHRRRGIGTRVIQSLATRALTHGASSVYLQVADENAGARRLYERLGFRHGYAYHYRTMPATGL